MSVWQWVYLAAAAGVLVGVVAGCRAIVDCQPSRLPVEDDSLRRTTDALRKVADR